jgi:AraC-like DNA-binding protein
LLASTDLPLKVIAASVGYKSRSYFTRAFTAFFGSDPTTYRALGGAEEEEPKPVERADADVRIIRQKSD